MAKARNIRVLGWVLTSALSGAAALAAGPPEKMPPITPGAFPPGAARALVQQKCTSCHVPSQVTAHRKSADQWAQTVDKMISLGAPVSDDEYTRIVDYLATNFGVVGAQPASGMR